jgi:hypothetical protein
MLALDPTVAASYAAGALAAAEASVDALIGQPGVTLAQAVAAKTAFVDAVFHTLRQAPIAATVGGTAYNWDARDEAVAALAAALTGNLMAQAATAVSGLMTALNSWIGSTSPPALPPVNTLNYGIVYSADVPALSYTPPALAGISWTPLGTMTPVSLAAADATTLIQAVASRRATLQAVRLALQASLGDCRSMANVIAVSVAGASW